MYRFVLFEMNIACPIKFMFLLNRVDLRGQDKYLGLFLILSVRKQLMKFLQKNPSLPEIKVDYLLSSQFRKGGSRNTDNSALEHRWKNSILVF